MRSRQEIFFRLKQEAMNLRFSLLGGPRTGPCEGTHRNRVLPDATPVFERLRSTPFAGEVEQIARQILEHRFPLLTFAAVETGPTIDWQRDPSRPAQNGLGWRRAAPPRLVPYMDFPRVGDYKLIWELNRHQHLPLLAQAWRFTGERAFLEEISSQVEQWRRANPIARGLNWASALEAAFRALSWIWVWHFAGEDLAPPARDGLLAGIEEHACYLEYNLSFYHSPNTHLIGEALALEAAGILFPEWRHAERWRRLGGETLARELYAQVRDDGTHFEQSTYYHVYTLDMFLLDYVLRGCPPDEHRTRQRLRLMAEYLAAVMGPSRRLPLIGDDDGGRFFHPYGRRDEFGRATLSTCGILLNEPAWIGDESDIATQAAWWLGAKALDCSGPAPRFESRWFADAGVAVMTAGNCQVVIDGGPMADGSAGHSHADCLSLVVRRGDEEILIDPGTYTYIVDPAERDRFRGTAAHNTIRIDARDQARAANPFRWEQKPDAELIEWKPGAEQDLFAARCRYGGFTHTRAVVFVKPEVVVIRDRVEGPPGEHLIEQFWHLGVALEGAGLIFPPDWPVETVEGGESGWRSPGLGRKEPALMLRVYCRGPLPVSRWTVLDLSGVRGVLEAGESGLVYRRGGCAVSVEEAGSNQCIKMVQGRQ